MYNVETYNVYDENILYGIYMFMHLFPTNFLFIFFVLDRTMIARGFCCCRLFVYSQRIELNTVWQHYLLQNAQRSQTITINKPREQKTVAIVTTMVRFRITLFIRNNL